ncbi:MAG: ABC transporter substrate-binding protein [Candidatus Dormibacteraeota bacterium]|nr:ABC transporter substrate-binding protein [Candidatus Dormibacteraeota bacterium]
MRTELRRPSASGVAIDNFNTIRSQILFLMFRNDVAPFNNVKVRQALAYAAPYQEIVQDVYRGKYATQWKGIISRDYPYFTDANWPYGGGDDVAKGKSLLAEAGHPNGFTSTMLYNADQPDSEQVAIKLQTAFDKIGAHFELQKLASAAFTDRYTGKKFDTLLVKELALTPDIGYATYLWYQSKAFVNVMNYNSPQVDQLSETILSNLDEKVRKTAGEQLQNIVVQDSPALFLAQPHFVVARRSNIKGVIGYTSRDLRFDDLDKT